MKRLYIFSLLFIALTSAFAQQNTITEANDAYSKNEFQKAITLYESVIKESGTSADLYYNLGNAYYKDKQYAPAILNYERALKLAPNFQDARFNLDIARMHIVDKIEAIEPPFLSQWIDNFKYTQTSNSWAVIGIVSFILLIGCAALYLFSRRVVIKKIGFFGGIALVIVTLSAVIFASEIKQELLAHDQAIVFAPTVTIKSSPSESGTDIFVLHEGTKVTIKSKLSTWTEIELSDGNKGWIPSDKIEVI